MFSHRLGRANRILHPDYTGLGMGLSREMWLLVRMLA